MSTNISQKVFEKIRKKEISAKPRWRFVLAHFLVGLLLIVFILVGALLLGLIIELAVQFNALEVLGYSGGRVLLASLPYFWIILVLAFSVLGVFEFFKTRHGYRYNSRYVALGFAALVLILGAGSYAAGFSGKTENYLEKNISFYSDLTKTPSQFWSQPESGLISGRIISNGNNSFKLQDQNGNYWMVNCSGANWEGRAQNKAGAEIKIIGEQTGSGQFRAGEISPWTGMGMMMRGGGQNGSYGPAAGGYEMGPGMMRGMMGN